ncbi:putative ectopic P granules protein 5-like [Apostichopus japonicus]|uniref:Putative ectopic P granules protein 5-like n=1 Tax=Stichopus japonicus TaxID=307972 RepID=A0A2G8K6I9_STIJA|nr:putative ectopic P granules protein 5-like [Apostichopus japonicus]
MAEAVRQKSRNKKKKKHRVLEEESTPSWKEVEPEKVTTREVLEDKGVAGLSSTDTNSAVNTGDVSSIPTIEVSSDSTDVKGEGEEVQLDKEVTDLTVTKDKNSSKSEACDVVSEISNAESTGEGEDAHLKGDEVVENPTELKSSVINQASVETDELASTERTKETNDDNRETSKEEVEDIDGAEKNVSVEESVDEGKDEVPQLFLEEKSSVADNDAMSPEITERASQEDQQASHSVQLLEEEENQEEKEDEEQREDEEEEEQEEGNMRTDAGDIGMPYETELSSPDDHQVKCESNEKETTVNDLVNFEIPELNSQPRESEQESARAFNIMDDPINATVAGATLTDVSATPLAQNPVSVDESNTDLTKGEDFEILEPQPTETESRSIVDPTAPDLLTSTLNSRTRSVASEPSIVQSWDTGSRFSTLRSISMSGVRFSEQRERTLTPMSEDDLKYYYFNHMIQNKESHVEQFLSECRIEKHNFFELVYNYYRARGNLLTVMKDVEKNQAHYKEKAENCWNLTQTEIPIKGVCADKLTVTSAVSSESAEFRENILKELEATLLSIRNCIHETFALCAYTAQLSKLQIESYLHMLLQSSPLLCSLESQMPCTSHMQLVGDPQTIHCIQELKECISVLFSFQRRPVIDTEFMESSRKWLERLVSHLLRVATYEDHFFLLNHLIRCPPGVESWAVSFLQLTFAQNNTRGSQEGVGDWWGSPTLDHFVHMLAVLMYPAKSRDEMLIRMRHAVSPDTPPTDALLNWTLLDEDGEEDERTADLPLNEGDLVALLTQFPFDELFKNVLVLPELGSACSQPVDAKHIMRLIAFSTAILKVFHEGLKTYNRSRYRQFVKRIGRLIRHTVQYVSVQWTQLRSNSEDIVEGYGPLNSMHMEQLSFARLQVEMDELFFRAVQCIMSSPRLGTWQFLADMPYTCLSGEMMWRLYWYLHSSFMGWADKTHVKDEARQADYEWWLADFSNRNMFCKRLLEMPMSEVIYLLTTFANMATSRGIDEEPFIRFVAKELYQITYVNKELREQLSKTGRELLYTVTACHPFTFSHLLMELEQTMESVGNMVLFLFSHLALHLLRPTPQDFERLHSWLLHFGPDTIQSQVARLVLAKLNWGVDEESKTLVLDLHLHRNVAVLLVEAHCKHFADKNRAGYQGVLQWNLSKFTYNIENFDFWAWDLMIKLRLHQQSQPYFDEAEHRSMCKESDSNWSVPNVATDTALYPVQKGLQENIPLACYVAVAMTETGHRLDQFLTVGLNCCQVLATTGYQRLCIPLLSVIVPMFMEEGHPDYLLSNESFLSNVKSILAADFHNARFSQRLLGSFPGETTKLFANMIME